MIEKDLEGNWQFSHALKGFVEPIRCIEIDAEHNIWASHRYKGLYKIQPENDLRTVREISFYSKYKGFPSNYKLSAFKITGHLTLFEIIFDMYFIIY